MVVWADTSGETSAGALQTRVSMEKPCSDVLAHTPQVGKGIPSDQSVSGYQE
jgi:hypothetical protein